jgi:hypothetical protein
LGKTIEQLGKTVQTMAQNMVKRVITLTAISYGTISSYELQRIHVVCPENFNDEDKVFEELLNIEYISFDYHFNSDCTESTLIGKKLKTWYKMQEKLDGNGLDFLDIMSKKFEVVDIRKTPIIEVVHIHMDMWAF